MKYRVLHLLSQRSSLTGSGVTLDALVRNAENSGWDQCVVVGVPEGDNYPAVGNLPSDKIHPLIFGNNKLPFPVPGMSDVMPYQSTKFSKMTEQQVEIYIDEWKNHLGRVISTFQPDVIHTHHIWLMSSIVKDITPNIPVLNQCHATGMRQMEFCPHLADRVKKGCARNERFQVLFEEHSKKLSEVLGINSERIHIIPSGYREDIFYSTDNNNRNPKAILYSGKYSFAKGLPWLLDAFEKLFKKIPGLQLHIAGSGAGDEAETLKRRMIGMKPNVELHGFLGQAELANLMRQCSVFVLPSFYEGIPLVLVEAAACGCRLISTRLPGVEKQLAPYLKENLQLVNLPGIYDMDKPVAEDLPAFVENLSDAIEISIQKAVSDVPEKGNNPFLQNFTWETIFKTVEKIWLELIEQRNK